MVIPFMTTETRVATESAPKPGGKPLYVSATLYLACMKPFKKDFVSVSFMRTSASRIECLVPVVFAILDTIRQPVDVSIGAGDISVKTHGDEY
jgi:hypothetical protein